MQFIIRWLVTAVAVGAAVWLAPGIAVLGTTESWIAVAITGLALSLIDMSIKPLLQLLSLPVTCLTFGIFYLVVNTAMLYLLRGYDVRDIALAPFQARHLFGEYVPARELGLDWGADCQVYLPPCLSAYVGADITCGLLACDILHASSPALLADVGTNGEMALLSDGTIYCCATAAGPAFEGVGISCGSAAVTGAIDAVTVENNALRCHVIGGGTARSLCGSGLLDAVAALRRLELVEDSGYMEEDLSLIHI